MSKEEQSPKQEPEETKSSGVGKFWYELKRRKVVRVAVTYIAVGWIITEVAATTFPRLGIPSWAESLILMFVILGFPIAVILAWAFQLTAEGIKVDSEVRTGGSIPDTKGNKLNYITLGLVVLVLTFLVVDRYLLNVPRSSDLPSTISALTDRTALASTIFLDDTAKLGYGVTSIGAGNQLISLSPNGALLVYVARNDTGSLLYKKNLNNFESPEPIPGTEGAIFSSFSPDGQSICFLTNDRLKRVSIDGEDLRTVATTGSAVRAHWTENDWIYVADVEGFILRRIQSAAGEVETLYNSRHGDNALLRFSYIFPDGQHALAMEERQSISSDYRQIVLMSLKTGEFVPLGISGYDARFISTGHLVFGRSKNLMAVRFDSEQGRILGEPLALLTGISMNSYDGYMQLSVSAGGRLAYVPGTDRAIGNVVAINRKGTETNFPNLPQLRYGPLDLRRDSGALAVHVADVSDYILIYDLNREAGRKLAGSDDYGWPRWNYYGNRLALTSYLNPELESRLLNLSIGDGKTQLVYASYEEKIFINDWSPNNEEFAIHGIGKIGFISSNGESSPRWVEHRHKGMEFLPVYSPDGQWVAYNSSETGRNEVWIRSHPDGDVRHQVSVNGGIEPVWSESGEIFFRRGQQIWSSLIQREPSLILGPEKLAFTLNDFIDTPALSYDVSTNGQTLYYVQSAEPVIDHQIHIIANWFEELERLMPAER